MTLKKWYVAHELLCFEPKSGVHKRGAKLTVWENLILIHARNAEEAYRKAIVGGKRNEGPVKIADKEGYCRFRGLRELSHVYDDLEDGAELEWRSFQIASADLRGLATSKRKLQAFRSAPRKQDGDKLQRKLRR